MKDAEVVGVESVTHYRSCIKCQGKVDDVDGIILCVLQMYNEAMSRLVSFPDRLSSVCIASSITRAILKAIRAGVGWVWDRDYI